MKRRSSVVVNSDDGPSPHKTSVTELERLTNAYETFLNTQSTQWATFATNLTNSPLFTSVWRKFKERLLANDEIYLRSQMCHAMFCEFDPIFIKNREPKQSTIFERILRGILKDINTAVIVTSEDLCVDIALRRSARSYGTLVSRMFIVEYDAFICAFHVLLTHIDNFYATREKIFHTDTKQKLREKYHKVRNALHVANNTAVRVRVNLNALRDRKSETLKSWRAREDYAISEMHSLKRECDMMKEAIAALQKRLMITTSEVHARASLIIENTRSMYESQLQTVRESNVNRVTTLRKATELLHAEEKAFLTSRFRFHDLNDEEIERRVGILIKFRSMCDETATTVDPIEVERFLTIEDWLPHTDASIMHVRDRLRDLFTAQNESERLVITLEKYATSWSAFEQRLRKYRDWYSRVSRIVNDIKRMSRDDRWNEIVYGGGESVSRQPRARRTTADTTENAWTDLNYFGMRLRDSLIIMRSDCSIALLVFALSWSLRHVVDHTVFTDAANIDPFAREFLTVSGGGSTSPTNTDRHELSTDAMKTLDELHNRIMHRPARYRVIGCVYLLALVKRCNRRRRHHSPALAS